MLGERLMGILRENWLLLLVIGGIVVAFLVLRTPASAVSPTRVRRWVATKALRRGDVPGAMC